MEAKVQRKKLNSNAKLYKQEKGITLIALIVTIVIMLILAGITIKLAIDDNGVIDNAKEAKDQYEQAQADEDSGLNDISSEMRKYLDANRDKVTIKISKQPETEKAGAVLLTVESVEGITGTTATTEEEYNNFVDSFSEEQKKEIIRNGYIKMANEKNPSANCTSFQEVLELLKCSTEEEFWNKIESNNGGVESVFSNILGEYVNYYTKRIELYNAINPDGIISNDFIVTDNGTYTFKIKDIITGKTYTKSVEVTNIDKSLPKYVAKTEKINGWTRIYLVNAETKKYTTFEEAYIILKGEKIIISNDVWYNSSTTTDEAYNYVSAEISNTAHFLVEDGIISNKSDLYGTTQTFILVKDKIEYKINVLITKGIPS